MPSGRESLLRQLDIAVIPSHQRTEREQAWIVWRQAQPSTDHLAQLGSVLRHGNPHLGNQLAVRGAEAVVRRDEPGIDRDGLVEIARGFAEITHSHLVLTPQVQVVCFGVHSLGRNNDPKLQICLELRGNRPGQIRFQRQHVAHWAVIRFRPQPAATRRVYKADGHPDPVSFLSYAAFEDVRYAKRSGNTRDISISAPEREGRRACNDAERRGSGKQVDDLLGDTVCEVLLIASRAQILEGKYRDRRSLVHGVGLWCHDPEYDRSDCGERDRNAHGHYPSRPMTGWRFVRQDLDSRQQSVTLAADQLQIAGIVRIVRERISQQLDPLTDRLRTYGAAAPDRNDEPIVGDHVGRGFHERQQQSISEAAQRNWLGVTQQQTPAGIQRQVTDAKTRGHRSASLLGSTPEVCALANRWRLR